MWYFDNHTRCENLHTLEALQERDSRRHYKTLAVRAARRPCGLGEGLSLLREDGRNALAAAYTRVSQNKRAARETRPKEGWALAQESKMYANGADDQRDEKDEQNEHAGGVFSDLSFAQILATALAAGVSFALSSQIGVAGSLIGAIVGAAAATVSSSVLNNLFSKSAEAIKGAVGPDDSGEPEAEKPAGASAAGQTKLMPHPVDADKTVAAAPAAAATQSAAAASADDTEVKFAPSGTRIAPASLRRAVHESQRRDTRKRLVVASVIAGVAAVLISALLVNALTQGKGIGTTPGRAQEPTTEETQTTQTEAEKPQETAQSEKPTASESTENADSSSNSSSDTTSSTTDSSTSGSGTSSDSGSSSSNGNSGTGTGNGSSSSSNSGSGSSSTTTGGSSSTTTGGSTSSGTGSSSDSSKTNGSSTNSSSTTSNTNSAKSTKSNANGN